MRRIRVAIAVGFRRSRRWVLLALATFCLLGAWAVSSPPQSAADDDFQMASIWCAGESPATGMCSPSTVAHDEFGVTMRMVPANIGAAPCYRARATASAACLAQASTALLPVRTNSGLYPEPFFSVMHWFAGSDVTASVLWMRLFNVFLAIVVWGSALAVAERGLRAAAALAWAAALVPLGTFFIPSTNASSWAIIGLGSLPVFLLQFLRGRGGIRCLVAGLGAAVSLFLATSARSDAAAFGGVTILACLVLTLLADGFAARRRLALVGVLIGAAAIIFLQSHIATSVATNGMGSAFAGMHAPPTSLISGFPLWLSNLYALPGLLGGALGLGWGLGWLDTGLPGVVGVVGCAVAAFVVVRGWASSGRAGRVATGVVWLALIVVPVQILQASHGFVGNLIQPRYIYPLVIVGIIIALAGHPVGGPPGFVGTRRQYAAIVIALAIAQAYALHTNIERYASGLGQEGIDPGYRHGWWWASSPVSPLWLWLLGCLAGSGTFAGLVSVAARTNGVVLVSWRPLYESAASRMRQQRAAAAERRRRRDAAQLHPVPDVHESAADTRVEQTSHRVGRGESIAPEPVEEPNPAAQILRRNLPRRATGSPRLGAPLRSVGRRRRSE